MDTTTTDPASSGDPAHPYGFQLMDDMAMEPEPAFVIKGYLDSDTNALLWGDPESGKSFLSLDWALSVAAGIPWQDHPVAQGTTAYLNAEEDGDFSKRLGAWRNEHHYSGELLAYALDYSLPLSEPQEQEWLVEQLEAMPKPLRLFVIDTLSANLGEWDESSPTHMAKLCNLARRIAKTLHIAVVIIHHNGWDKRHLRGASSLKGNSTTVMKLMPDGNTGKRTLTVEKRRIGAKPEPKAFWLKEVCLGEDRSSCVLERVVDGERSTKQASPSKTEPLSAVSKIDAKWEQWVIDGLRGHTPPPRGWTKNAIYEIVLGNRNNVLAAVDRLVKRGILHKEGKAFFPGESLLEAA